MARLVLVVDDEASFRALARRVLTMWGHVVVGEAGTAADALLRAAELRPDTVLVDLGLPDGDGFTLARGLRALPSAPTVVMLSSDRDVAHARAAASAGACGFVSKEDLAGAHLRGLLEEDLPRP